MEFASKEELYQKIIPVFNVKKRILSITKYKNITNTQIWEYLIINKWKDSHNLTLNEIVNDIITINPEKIIGGRNEEIKEKK